MTIVVLIAGPPGCEYEGVSAQLAVSLFVVLRVVLNGFGVCCGGERVFSLLFIRVVRPRPFDTTVPGEHDFQKHPLK